MVNIARQLMDFVRMFDLELLAGRIMKKLAYF